MKIGELAKVTGVPSHTIRFYESKGLMPKVGRSANGYRIYGEESKERLERISCAKRLGFSLDDMLTILVKDAGSESLDHDKLIQQLDARLQEVENMMSALMVQREEIKRFKETLLDTWQQGECLNVASISNLNPDEQK